MNRKKIKRKENENEKEMKKKGGEQRNYFK